jgi:hypothetical protein
MRNLVIYGLILLALAFICEATEPVQLSGGNGQAILKQIANIVPSNNTPTNTSTNASANVGLWNWGGIPAGYVLNKSGMLALMNSSNWTPSI